MRYLFEDDGVQAMLMVYASNAFNSLNREAALRNIRIHCPILSPMLTNMYRTHSMLFIDGDCILSQEGTTQGNPLAMAMYAIGTLPLIHKLQGNVTQVWYADDASAGGKTLNLRVWWDSLVSCGPHFGYNPNPCKTWLVVKPEHLPAAEEHFQVSGVNITTQGHRHLGAPLGSESFVEEFIRDKISCWGSEIKRLSEIAKFQPQAAYAVFTHALTNRWTFLMHTVPSTDLLLQPLEEAIRHQFLPAVTGRQGITDLERDPLALPARHGGLGVLIPTRNANNQFKAFTEVTAPLVELIRQRNPNYPQALTAKQRQTKFALRIRNRREITKEAELLKPKLTGAGQRAMELVSEKGASAWLTAIPMSKYGFNRPLEMPSVLGLAGHQQGYPRTAHVVKHLVLATPSAAQRGPCLPSDTMLSETSLHNFSRRYAGTSVLNPHSSH